MYMFMKEGLVKGDVDTYVAAHSRDERWEGMADEMMTLQRLGPHWAPERWEPDEETGSGGLAIEAAPGAGAEADAGQLMMLEGPEEEMVGGDAAEQGGDEEAGMELDSEV